MTKLFLDPQSGTMIRSLFINKQAAEKGARRPENVPPMPTKKIAMLGAGLMGAGIAMVAAQAGIEVVLLDRDMAAAEKGKAYTAERLAKRRTDPAKMEAVLGRIHPTADYDDLAGCDLIIEAVFEDRGIKDDVTEKIEAAVGADVIFGSNTSTLPITGLAAAGRSPRTSSASISSRRSRRCRWSRSSSASRRARRRSPRRSISSRDPQDADRRQRQPRLLHLALLRHLCRGGAALLGEGVGPALIENFGRHMGMPVGPLAVNDEVGLDLSLRSPSRPRPTSATRTSRARRKR